jgi:hypothetical protein
MGGRAIPDNAWPIGLFLRARPLAVFSWWTEFRVQQQRREHSSSTSPGWMISDGSPGPAYIRSFGRGDELPLS